MIPAACIPALAQLLWNIVDSIDLYKTFVVIFTSSPGRESQIIRYYKVFAWGGAFIPPTIAFIVDRDNFITMVDKTDIGTGETISEPSICWINMSSDLKWVFIVPIFIVVTTGVISTVHIVRAIRQSTTHPAFRSAMYTAKIVVTIATATGVTWIFAVMIVVSSELAFSYCFALFASSQGAALFYFHVRCHSVLVSGCASVCAVLSHTS
jgi:hypothetical protein